MSQVSNKDYPRRIVIDDTDQRIQYSGQWTVDTGSFDERGSFGPPYRRTMHGTNETGASFSFAFEGEYIVVKGARDFRGDAKAPTWTCAVDGGIIPAFPYANERQVTHQALCEQRRLSRRAHTLTVNVTIDDPADQTFWVDYVEFAYLPETNVDSEIIRVDSSDWTSITYNNATAQWEELNGGFNGTKQLGASLNFSFNGTSASLYSFNEGSNEDWVATSGRYYIDNSGDTTFTIPGSKRLSNGSRSDFNNQLLFTTPTLSAGEHELVLTFEGQKTGDRPIQWLIVDYFHVTAASPSPSKFPVAAIAGIVAGGVVLIAGIALAVIFYMRRRKEEQPTQAIWSGAGGAFRMDSRNDPSVITPFLADAGPAPTMNSTSYMGYNSYTHSEWSGTGTGTTKGGGNWNATATPGDFGSNRNVSGSGRTSYPPEKRPNRLSTSADGSDGRDFRPLPNPAVLSPPLPPASSSTSYYDPYDPYVDTSLSYSNPTPTSHWRSMKSAQRDAVANQQSQAVHVHHEDSGVRLPRTLDQPPDYTRD